MIHTLCCSCSTRSYLNRTISAQSLRSSGLGIACIQHLGAIYATVYTTHDGGEQRKKNMK